MGAPTFICWNSDTSAATGPPSTAATSATGGTVKTMLQIKSGSSTIRVVEWGYTFDAIPAAPVRMELVDTALIFATVTTIGSGVRTYNDSTGPASLTVAGTTATGFTATGEGSITASRLFGYQYESGIYFKQQFPLGREPELNASSALRIRATPTTSVAINVACYIVWEE